MEQDTQAVAPSTVGEVVDTFIATGVEGGPDARFVLILQEQNGKLEMAGIQEPEEFDETKVSHLVARYFQDTQNIQLFIAHVVAAYRAGKDTVIGPDRERTVLLPDGT